MQLAGVSGRDRDVLELSGLLGDAGFDELAERLLMALANERPVVSLTIDEREMIIRSLDDPPESLDELSAVLLREHEWRVREGRVEPTVQPCLRMLDVKTSRVAAGDDCSCRYLPPTGSSAAFSKVEPGRCSKTLPNEG